MRTAPGRGATRVDHLPASFPDEPPEVEWKTFPGWQRPIAPRQAAPPIGHGPARRGNDTHLPEPLWSCGQPEGVFGHLLGCRSGFFQCGIVAGICAELGQSSPELFGGRQPAAGALRR